MRCVCREGLDFAYFKQTWRSDVPTRLPEKPRAKSIRADRRGAIDQQAGVSKPRAAAKPDTLDNIDWLALCALSLAVSAIFIAALVYFGEGDATGAASVLAGTAGIIAIAMFSTKAPADRA
jgi:hypothetical protein